MRVPSSHLVIIRADIAAKIRDGNKSAESRLSVNRPPAWFCEAGDFLWFKVSGGDIVLTATAAQINRFENLRACDIPVLAELFSPTMGTLPTNPYWEQKQNARYAVFITLSDVKPCYIAKHRIPRSFGSAWIRNFQVAQFPTGSLDSTELPLCVANAAH